jgi:hypothetical protein
MKARRAKKGKAAKTKTVQDPRAGNGGRGRKARITGTEAKTPARRLNPVGKDRTTSARQSAHRLNPVGKDRATTQQARRAKKGKAADKGKHKAKDKKQQAKKQSADRIR